MFCGVPLSDLSKISIYVDMSIYISIIDLDFAISIGNIKNLVLSDKLLWKYVIFSPVYNNNW